MIDNLAPPPMSDIDIREFLPPVDSCARKVTVEALPCATGLEYAEVPDWSFRVVAEVVEKAIAARDEQWRQRLEQVGTTDLDGNLLALTALPDGTPLYRIKEHGLTPCDGD